MPLEFYIHFSGGEKKITFSVVERGKSRSLYDLILVFLKEIKIEILYENLHKSCEVAARGNTK